MMLWQDGIAAASGSSIVVSTDGVITVVPGWVPNASQFGGVFVGLPNNMKFVAEP